jgi:hypothetical protein
MRIAKILALVLLGAATLCFTLSPVVKADTWDKKTIVTFEQDTEIPGWVLPAGTYVFKLLRGGVADRCTVQIWDGSESQIYAALHAVPEISSEAPGRAYFTLDNRDADEGLPPLLRSWFYPGDNT